MANSKLLKEAIADAKAVKETALANAKLALEEAFTPRLQAILSQKMRQEAEMEGGDEQEPVEEELSTSGIGSSDVMGKTPGKQPALDADTDLSVGVKKSSANSATAVSDYTKTKDINEEEEIGGDDKEAEIAELRARLAELEGMDSEEEDTDDEAMYSEEDDEMADMGSDDEGGEDYAITGDEEEDTEEDDMDLEAIIRELEAQLGDEEAPAEDEMAAESYSDGAEAGTDKSEDPKVVMTTEAEEEKEETDEVIDLEEILREMEEDMKDPATPDKEDAGLEAESLKKDLNEAYKTIKSLQSTINEVNLLNAKLLFANKLFRAHNMTNEQKVKVIETLDRTKSVREVKLVYSTLAENLKQVTPNKIAKKSITEGFASKVVKSTKPAAAAQKQVIAENTDFADRFKKLAGIIK